MWVDFEGIDGSGKTTLSIAVARRLRERGFAVTHVREQGSFRSALVNRMRELTRNADSVRLSGTSELLLGAAREGQLIVEEIRPALAKGHIVITDRGLHSHAAVALAVRRLDPGAVEPVLRFASDGLWPDAVVFVDTDPDVARGRRRLRKIRERRSAASGRKSLLGQSMPRRCREALRTMLLRDPARWRVMDNSALGREEAERGAWALVAPFLGLDPGPGAPARSAAKIDVDGGPDAWVRRFLEHAGAQDAATALLLLSGLHGPEAEALRARAAAEAPDVALWSVTGADTPEAWRIRREAADREPWHAARSLKGLESDAAWDLRRRLTDRAPDAVAASLSKLTSERAWEARAQLSESCPDEILRGLGGLDDPRAWELRQRLPGAAEMASLAESVLGLDSPRAWEARDRCVAEHPVPVLKSLKGLVGERAWELRRSFRDDAPSEVLATLRGIPGDAADRLRDDLEDEHPEETAESVAGLADEDSWERRERLAAEGPGGVISSVMPIREHPLAKVCVQESINSCEGRPRVVRKAVLFHHAPAGETEKE